MDPSGERSSWLVDSDLQWCQWTTSSRLRSFTEEFRTQRNRMGRPPSIYYPGMSPNGKYSHNRDWHFIFTLGLEQSRQLQDLWFYKIHSSRYRQQIRGCCNQLYPERKNHSSLENCKTVISLLCSLSNWTSWKIISTPSVPNQAYSLASEISDMCPITISGILSRTTKLRPSRLQRKKSVLMFWTPGLPPKVWWQCLFLWCYNSVSIKGC